MGGTHRSADRNLLSLFSATAGHSVWPHYKPYGVPFGPGSMGASRHQALQAALGPWRGNDPLTQPESRPGLSLVLETPSLVFLWNQEVENQAFARKGECRQWFLCLPIHPIHTAAPNRVKQFCTAPAKTHLLSKVLLMVAAIRFAYRILEQPVCARWLLCGKDRCVLKRADMGWLERID